MRDRFQLSYFEGDAGKPVDPLGVGSQGTVACGGKMEKVCNFRAGKDPCWILLDCSRYVYPECPAYVHPERPCWSHASTQAEKLIGIERECKFCKVFRVHSP